MDHNKVTSITSTFNKYDIRSFNKFLDSPWFNSVAELKPLFHLFLSKGSQDLSREKIYLQVTAKSKYNDKHMRYLVSGLTRCLEDFLACSWLFADEALLLRLRMKSLAERDCEKSFDYNSRLYSKLSASKKDIDASWYLERFLHSYLSLDYSHRKDKRKDILPFDRLMLELDQFYVAKKLQLHAGMINAQNVLSAGYNMNLSDEILALASPEDFKSIPIIAAYYHVVMTLADSGSEKHFNELRTLIADHSGQFPVNELNDLYQYIKNYCIKKINLGEDGYRSVLFDIYREILGNRKLLKADYLSQWEFKNITTLGLRLGYLEWVKTFIKKYNYFLRPGERRNAYVYNMANWHFHSRQYADALKLIQKVEFTDVYYQLDTRSILLKTYFETGDDEALFFHGAAFITFLTRNRLVSVYHRSIYKSLVNFTLSLARAGSDSKRIRKLYEKLALNLQVADRQWIIQETEELL